MKELKLHIKSIIVFMPYDDYDEDKMNELGERVESSLDELDNLIIEMVKNIDPTLRVMFET